MQKIKTLDILAKEEFQIETETPPVPSLPPIKTLKGKQEPIFTSFLETKKHILEQINPNELSVRSDPAVGVYIKYSKANGEIKLINEYNYENNLFKPIVNDFVRERAILLPSDVEEYGSDDKLIEEIKEFLFEYFEPPPSFEGILPALLLFYWISDKFPFVPYLHFVGLTGTGKTTALEVFGSICYKAIDGAGAITPASLFRLSHEWRGTLLLDEFELGGKNGEVYQAMLQILKSGVSDKPIFRTEGEGKKKVQIYRMKAPRIFTSENPVTNAALQSRMLVVQMSKNSKRLPLYRLQNFFKRAQLLRNKLLLWRLRKIGQINLNEIEYGYKELSPFDGRVQQVLTPIYYLSNKKVRKIIFDFAKKQEEDTKRERLDELEGQIFLYLFEHYKGDISISEITEFINKKREKEGYRTKFTERKIGSVVRKVFNLDTERRADGYYVVIKEKKILDLAAHFGLTPPTDGSQRTQSSSEDPYVKSSEPDSVKEAEELFNT